MRKTGNGQLLLCMICSSYLRSFCIAPPGAADADTVADAGPVDDINPSCQPPFHLHSSSHTGSSALTLSHTLLHGRQLLVLQLLVLQSCPLMGRTLLLLFAVIAGLALPLGAKGKELCQLAGWLGFDAARFKPRRGEAVPQLPKANLTLVIAAPCSPPQPQARCQGGRPTPRPRRVQPGR